jgi:class 3 adenylate cyclase
VVWTLHVLLPLGILAWLLAFPSVDGTWHHNPTHFWLVAAVAGANLVVANRISQEAARRDDARLMFVSLGFIASAAFFLAHALVTPQVIASGPSVGFSLSMPVGLFLAGVCAVLSSVSWSTAVSERFVRAAGGLRIAILALALLWMFLSLNGVPPLDRALDPGGFRVAALPLAVVSVVLFAYAAVRYWRLHRTRPSPVALALMTSFVLLGEAMVVVASARAWQASWWLWHVVVLLGYGYVAYAAYAEHRAEGRPGWLFASVGLDATIEQLRREWGEALERLVSAIEVGRSDADAAASDVGSRFGLTTGQTQILAEAGASVASERRRARVLTAVSRLTHGRLAEVDGDALIPLATSALGDALETTVEFWPVGVGGADRPTVSPEDFRGDDPRLVEGGGSRVMAYPVRRGSELAAVLAVHTADGHQYVRDTDLIQTFATHLGLTLENVTLYRDLRGLFGSYVSPELASRLLDDPTRAALGGSVIETTVLFADLRGFTRLSEDMGKPDEIVALLNRYFKLVVPIVLESGGTVDKFVGDALMAVYNTPVLQPDHALRAVTAADRMQRAVNSLAAEHETWPRFRVGVNTGVALVGNIGSDELRNFTAIGDAVNVAARLETAAEPGQVLIGATTQALVAHRVRSEPAGTFEVKGRREPVEAYRVLGVG